LLDCATSCATSCATRLSTRPDFTADSISWEPTVLCALTECVTVGRSETRTEKTNDFAAKPAKYSSASYKNRGCRKSHTLAKLIQTN
jgi:hypothetical protein